MKTSELHPIINKTKLSEAIGGNTRTFNNLAIPKKHEYKIKELQMFVHNWIKKHKEGKYLLKQCSKCKDIKSVECFSYHNKEKDKLNSRCKSCYSELYYLSKIIKIQVPQITIDRYLKEYNDFWIKYQADKRLKKNIDRIERIGNNSYYIVKSKA